MVWPIPFICSFEEYVKDVLRTSGSERVERGSQNGGDDDPEELEPVKERYPYEFWLTIIIEGRPEHSDKGNEE